MAKTRDCDNCGRNFSERTADWASLSGTVHGRYDDGSEHNRNETIDLCPDCTAPIFGMKVVNPVQRTAITQTAAYAYGKGRQSPVPTPPPGMKAGMKIIAVDEQEYGGYIKYLEKNVGIGETHVD